MASSLSRTSQYHDPEFNIKISNKREFSEIYKEFNRSMEEIMNEDSEDTFTMNSQQLFVRNFLSHHTPYNNLLLYHGLGTGKTCTSIAVAMEKVKYMKVMNIKKKVIGVASPNVQDNFKKELFHESKLIKHVSEWRLLTCVGQDILNIVNPANILLEKEKLIARVQQFIQENFEFYGYTKFSNVINEHIRSGKLKEKFEESLVIIDEIHNIRVGDDTKNKRIADSLVSMVQSTSFVQLLLLSATPMFNNYKEIIWLMNLMNMNDNRPIVSHKDIFDVHGNFRVDENGEEIGLKTFVRKITGYVSFVKGENPINFPFRIFPRISIKVHPYYREHIQHYNMIINKYLHQFNILIYFVFLYRIIKKRCMNSY